MIGPKGGRAHGAQKEKHPVILEGEGEIKAWWPYVEASCLLPYSLNSDSLKNIGFERIPCNTALYCDYRFIVLNSQVHVN